MITIFPLSRNTTRAATLEERLVTFMVLGVTAQVHTQKGIVRKVTRSASDPFIPVQGVQVIVSGEANKASDKDGRFSLKVKVTDKAGSYTDSRACATRFQVYVGFAIER